MIQTKDPKFLDDINDAIQTIQRNFENIHAQMESRGKESIFDPGYPGYKKIDVNSFIRRYHYLTLEDLNVSNSSIKLSQRFYTTREINSLLEGNPDLGNNPEDLKLFKEEYLDHAENPGEIDDLIKSQFPNIKTLLSELEF